MTYEEFKALKPRDKVLYLCPEKRYVSDDLSRRRIERNFSGKVYKVIEYNEDHEEVKVSHRGKLYYFGIYQLLKKLPV